MSAVCDSQRNIPFWSPFGRFKILQVSWLGALKQPDRNYTGPVGPTICASSSRICIYRVIHYGAVRVYLVSFRRNQISTSTGLAVANVRSWFVKTAGQWFVTGFYDEYVGVESWGRSTKTSAHHIEYYIASSGDGSEMELYPGFPYGWANSYQYSERMNESG